MIIQIRKTRENRSRVESYVYHVVFSKYFSIHGTGQERVFMVEQMRWPDNPGLHAASRLEVILGYQTGYQYKFEAVQGCTRLYNTELGISVQE